MKTKEIGSLMLLSILIFQIKQTKGQRGNKNIIALWTHFELEGSLSFIACSYRLLVSIPPLHPSISYIYRMYKYIYKYINIYFGFTFMYSYRKADRASCGTLFVQ